MAVGLASVGTALPRWRIGQDEVLDYMQRFYGAGPRLSRRLRYIYRRSHIDARYTCCPDFAPQAADGYLQDDPSTACRMRMYYRHVVPLAAEAARAAFQAQTAWTPDQVTHLVFASCTGFTAPGPDVALVDALGLDRGVQRTQVGFMGCQAALPALRVGADICRADPRAVVLVVCAELCTLHFQRQPTDENLVVNSLFADGAAAVLMGPAPAPLCRLEDFYSRRVPGGDGLITWDIGDRGFEMGLQLNVPAVLGKALPGFVSGVDLAGLDLSELDHAGQTAWAVHPGGRSILDAVESSLGLAPEALAASRHVLRHYGNMSSPSVLFVLQRLLATTQTDHGVLLAFGPGLSLEAATWRR